MKRLASALVLALLLTLMPEALLADDVRVRIAWGGGAERVWQGTIAASDHCEDATGA